MIDAFELGGDFHSRTAVSMYPHIKKAIENNEVCLEKGTHDSNIPLVKDKFTTERKLAK